MVQGTSRGTWGVLVACGKDQLLSSKVDSAFLSLGDKPLIAYSLAAFEQCHEIEGVVVIVQKERLPEVQAMAQMFGFSKVRKAVAGGATRLVSVRAALAALDEEVTVVAIHEATRPCVTSSLIGETVKVARRYGAAVAAAPIADIVKAVSKGRKTATTLNGGEFWAGQMPQAFQVGLLAKALAAAAKKRAVLPDEASALERIKKDVYIVPSTSTNIKVLSPDDLALAGVLLRL